MSKFFIIIAVILIISNVGSALWCWKCNTEYDKNCEPLPQGPQDPNSLPNTTKKYYVNCDEESSLTGKYKLCRKQIQSIDGKERTVRSCGIEESNKQCYSTATPQVKTLACQCFGDGCNISSQLYFSHFLIIVCVVFSSLIYSKCWYHYYRF